MTMSEFKVHEIQNGLSVYSVYSSIKQHDDFKSRRKQFGATTYLTCNESGSKGWVARECIDWESLFSSCKNSSGPVQFKWKEKSEIQVAGMLAFYILTKGEHPFGAEICRMMNLYENKPVGLEKLDDEVVTDLLSQMLDQDLDKRPYVEQALKHPFFLCAKEQMKLLEGIGNQPEVQTVDETCDIVKLLDLDPSRPRSPLLPADWKAVIHPDDLKAFCEGGRPPSSLDGSRYSHCLRLMRNVCQQWHDKQRPALRGMLQETRGEEYFLQLFPTLPLGLHRFIRVHPDWSTRPALEEFFPVINRRP